jgi:hypothetical protein
MVFKMSLFWNKKEIHSVRIGTVTYFKLLLRKKNKVKSHIHHGITLFVLEYTSEINLTLTI